VVRLINRRKETISELSRLLETRDLRIPKDYMRRKIAMKIKSTDYLKNGTCGTCGSARQEQLMPIMVWACFKCAKKFHEIGKARAIKSEAGLRPHDCEWCGKLVARRFYLNVPACQTCLRRKDPCARRAHIS
jgi:ribosomal protein L37AE/L43A